MEWKTRIGLARIRHRLSPSRRFRSSLHARLSAEAGFAGTSRRIPRFAAAGACVITLFLGSGAGVYAYESPDVVEGHPLYAVKREMESVEGRLATTPEKRATFQAKLKGRRLKEVERLREKGNNRQQRLKAELRKTIDTKQF